MTYCQSIFQTLRIIWFRRILLILRSKTRRWKTPLLPSWIYSCQSEGTVSYALPFTTNVTISTFISQTLRSWVAIFHLRQPMAFVSHNTYGMPGLAPLLNDLFWGLCDFHISFLNSDMSWNVWNRPSGSFMVNMGNLIKHYEVPPSQMLHDILGHYHIQGHPPFLTHLLNRDLDK